MLNTQRETKSNSEYICRNILKEDARQFLSIKNDEIIKDNLRKDNFEQKSWKTENKKERAPKTQLYKALIFKILPPPPYRIYSQRQNIERVTPGNRYILIYTHIYSSLSIGFLCVAKVLKNQTHRV